MKPKTKRFALLLAIFFAASASNIFSQENKMNTKLKIGTKEYYATFEGKTSQEVFALFPLELSMNEWARNNEFYTHLPKNVASTESSPKSFATGDIALYHGVSLVIFYAPTTNTSGYVLLGKIKNPDGIKSALVDAKGKVLFEKSDENQSANQNQNDEEKITELYKRMYRAMIAKDFDEMAKVHDKSFVLVHMTGTKMNQSEYFAAVKDGTLNYFSADHDDISVKVSGNKATLCGKSRVNAAVYGGGRHTWRLQQDMTLEKINGEWKFTHSKASTYSL